MSTIKSSSEHLTLNADGSGNDIKFQSNAVEKASLSDAGLLTTSGGASLDGAVTINDSGADVNFRVESSTNANALVVDGGTGNVGIGIVASVNEFLSTGNSSTTTYNTTLTHATGDDCALAIKNSSDTPNNFCGINFLDGGGFANSGIFNVNENHDSGGGGYLTILTREDSTTPDTMTQRLRVDGDGLKFNADTAAANALDDYEEGTWTPRWYGTTSGASEGNPAGSAGKYTKIGNVVFISLFGQNIVDNESPAIVGNVRIDGLPFTTASADKDDTILSVYLLYVSSTSGWIAQTQHNSDYMFIYNAESDFTELAIGDLGNFSDGTITGYYFTA